MQLEIHPADFKNAPVKPGPQASLLSWGAEAAVLADGPDSVIKLYFNDAINQPRHLPNPHVLRGAAKEFNALHLMNGQNQSGLQLPRPLEIAAFESPIQSGGRGYIAALRMTRLEGQEIGPARHKMSAQQTQQLMFDTGYTIGTLHNMARPLPRTNLLPFENVGEQFFTLAAKGPSKFISPREVVALEKLHYSRPQASEQLLLHSDLGPHNMLFNSEMRPTGVVDWGRAKVGPRSDDFFHCATNFQNLNLPVEARLGPALNGYATATGQKLDAEQVRLSTMLHLGTRILQHENGTAYAHGFDDFLLKPFKQMVWPHLPTSPKNGAQMLPAPAPKPSRLN